MSTIWIDDAETINVDGEELGFLVEIAPQGRKPFRRLQANPLRTNLSGEPKLTGWCGTTNNVSRDAEGLAFVARRAKNGRVCVVPVEATRARLEGLGYPELYEGDDDEPEEQPEDWSGKLLAEMHTSHPVGKHGLPEDWRFGHEINRLIVQLRDVAGCKLVTTKGEEPDEAQMRRAYAVCMSQAAADEVSS